MAKMNGNIERFQAIGKSVLQLAVQPQMPPQPRTSVNPPTSSQQAPYQLASSNTYSQANPPQPPPLPASSSSSQLNFPQQASQGLDQYADNGNLLGYSLEDLLNS